MAAAGLFFEPTQMESARPLYMLARLPLGPAGGRREAGLDALGSRRSWPSTQSPLVTMAYLPAAKMSASLWPVTAATERHVALVDQRGHQPMVFWKAGWS